MLKWITEVQVIFCKWTARCSSKLITKRLLQNASDLKNSMLEIRIDTKNVKKLSIKAEDTFSLELYKRFPNAATAASLFWEIPSQRSSPQSQNWYMNCLEGQKHCFDFGTKRSLESTGKIHTEGMNIYSHSTHPQSRNQDNTVSHLSFQVNAVWQELQ